MVICIKTFQGACNTYCVHDIGTGRAVVIDPTVSYQTIHTAMRDFNISIEAVLLTHGHHDHIGAVDEYKHVPCYIHQADLYMPTDTRNNLSRYFGVAFKAEATLTSFACGQTLHLANMEIHCAHIGGHTTGSSIFRIGTAVFTGDTLFSDCVGRTDFPHSTTHEELINNIDKNILTLPDKTHIFPGHGEQSTLWRIKQENPYI